MTSTPAPDDDFSRYPVAGLGRRLAALFYDAFLVAPIWMLCSFAVLLLSGAEGVRLVNGVVHTAPVQDAVLFVLMLLSCLAFCCWFWRRGGQTLGMAAWRIKVVSMEGGAPGRGQAVVRFIGACMGLLAFFAGYLWSCFDPEGNTLHDRLSRTRVILLPKSTRRL